MVGRHSTPHITSTEPKKPKKNYIVMMHSFFRYIHCSSKTYRAMFLNCCLPFECMFLYLNWSTKYLKHFFLGGVLYFA